MEHFLEKYKTQDWIFAKPNARMLSSIFMSFRGYVFGSEMQATQNYTFKMKEQLCYAM